MAVICSLPVIRRKRTERMFFSANWNMNAKKERITAADLAGKRAGFSSPVAAPGDENVPDLEQASALHADRGAVFAADPSLVFIEAAADAAGRRFGWQRRFLIFL